MQKPKSFKNLAGEAFFLLVFLCLFCAKSFADTPIVKNITFTNPNNLEITISQKSYFKAFTLKNPHRLVIDIKGATLENSNLKPTIPHFVNSVRTRDDKVNLRIVFDLKEKINLDKTFFKKSQGQENGIITLQISGPAKNQATESPTKNSNEPTKYIVNNQTQTNITKNIKIPIIVIDSGHGGKDPGTIGNYARTQEKNLTLSYAKELKKHLENTKKYKVYLTRNQDVFIPLRKRVETARRLKADLFISLHANSISDKSVSGLSIYTLSEKSSDRQAELLAQKENRSDIISGINFDGASQDIMKTLIDLSQRDVKNSSSLFANTAIKISQASNIQILENTHRFAGFVVLTAPDMVSVLIELGYLSNRNEEKLLNSLSYKRKVAESLTKAIDEYFSKTKNKL